MKDLTAIHPAAVEGPYRWTQRGRGYEVSTIGDKRFSALRVRLDNGLTLEEFYQCRIKGYDPEGQNWRLGKGKPPLDPKVNLWEAYLGLWRQWAQKNPLLLQELSQACVGHDYVLRDTFAKTEVNQARALATLLNEQHRTRQHAIQISETG